jgi:hypothetical protein
MFLPILGGKQRAAFRLLVDGDTRIRVAGENVYHNGRPISDEGVILMPGDILRLTGHSIEILDCPVEMNPTVDKMKFIDSPAKKIDREVYFSKKLALAIGIAVAICFSSFFSTGTGSTVAPSPIMQHRMPASVNHSSH